MALSIAIFSGTKWTRYLFCCVVVTSPRCPARSATCDNMPTECTGDDSDRFTCVYSAFVPPFYLVIARTTSPSSGSKNDFGIAHKWWNETVLAADKTSLYVLFSV